MSREARRANIRCCILTELVASRWVTDRQRAAAMHYLKDAELAANVRAGAMGGITGAYGSIGASSPSAKENRIGCFMPGAIDAARRHDALLELLRPSERRLFGAIQMTNRSRKGSLSGLPVKTATKTERDDVLVKRGRIAQLLEVVADHYRLPEEA